MYNEERTTGKNKQILVLGIGNEILMDDGIGPKLVKRLQKAFNEAGSTVHETPEIVFETLFIGGLGILEFIEGYNTVIIIDAIKTKDGIPGTVYHCTPDDFKETLHLSSFHDTSFLTALKFGEKLGFQIPENIQIIAVEIVEDRTFGNDFTPPLQKKCDDIFNYICSYIKNLKLKG